MKRNWEEKITHMLDQIEPSQQQTHQMWTAILQSKTKKEPKKFPVFRFTAVGMCILVLSVGTGIGVNAATDGALFSSLRSFVSQPEQQKKVASEGLKKSSFTEVYAPPLVGCSDAYIIFANERGLMIYGRNQEKLLAALDLQALDCNYFNADTVMTHIMMEDDMLYMYNEYKDETKTSQIYRYDLMKAGQENALSMVDDATEIETIQKKWKKFAANRKDTFDSIPLAQGEWNGSEKLKYSEESLVWTDQNGDKQLSCMLTLADGTYQLYTCSLKDRTDGKTETLALHQTEDTRETQKLPAFVYTGNDKIMKTLCDYMCSQDYGYSGEVYIPAPVVYKTVEEDDGVVVFANLWSFTYNPNGNTLDCEGGGEQPSRLKLKPDKKGGYIVQEHLEAGDGAEYQKDIEAFCNGYPVAVSKFTEEGKNYEKIRKELVKMYVDDHGLDFKYYKDYGWDPVSL